MCFFQDVGNLTTWTVRGLQLGTEYRFSVMASNHLGSSKYNPDTFKVTTSSEYKNLITQWNDKDSVLLSSYQVDTF